LLVSDCNQKAKKLYQEIGFKNIQTQMLKVNNVVQMSAAAHSSKELVEAI